MSDIEIDAIIKARLATFPCKGGTTSSKKTTWSQSELELIDKVILDYISKKGCSREVTAHKIMERWDISLATARRYINDCIHRMADAFEEDSEKLRKVWLERVENILESAIATGNKEAAIRSLDLMAKSLGLYRENINISGGDIPIKFDFS